MTDTVGRLAFTIAGSFFGPWGALVGGFLGSLLFPVEGPKGPRLSELNIQHSTVGAPIPIVYGTAQLAGNIIFSGGLVETEHEGGGGKGGPSGPTTYSYAVDVAIGICEGPISGVRRIWADADLIYDASDDETLAERLFRLVESGELAEVILGIRAASAQVNFDLYLGDEDQLPDPTIESHVGVGNTPAYRGLAYIVFPNFQLEKYGNRIPNFRFEVYTGAPTECGIYSAGELHPWIEGTRDPRNELNVHEYSADGSTGWTTDLQSVLNTFITGGRLQMLDQPQWGWGAGSSPLNSHSTCQTIASADRIRLFMYFNSLPIPDAFECDELNTDTATVCEAFEAAFGLENVVHWSGLVTSGGTSGSGFYVITAPGEPEGTYFDGQFLPGSADCGGGRELQWMLDESIGVRRSISPPSGCALGEPLAGAPGFCSVGGQVVQAITWTPVAGTFHVLQEYTTDGSNGVLTYPLNPCLISTDPNYNDQAYWEAAYAAAVADGAMLNATTPLPGDWVYGVDYPQTQSSAYFSECDTVTTACVPMATIVADICRRSGLRTDTDSQIDVSDLTTCVPGYIVGRQMSGREAMGPLRMFGLFDAVEADAQLVFRERGHDLVATLTDDDLGGHEHGSEPPPKVEVSRTQEKDLPRRLRLHFPNFLHDHEVSEQSASRITTEAIDELDVELPVSMEPDTAKQLAEIMLYEAWISRNRYRFSLDNDWLGLEPTDCVGLPVDGSLERVRIVAIDYKIGGLLQVEGVRDDGDGYVSTAVAVPGEPSGGVPGSSGGGPICDSEVVLLDIPCLTGTPPSGEAWIYGAVYSACADFWNSAALYRSDDGGETYGQIARTDHETTVGSILEITGPATDPTLPGDSPPYDSANSITVNLFEGTLASVSDAGIDAGLNLAAIGAPGRWVIIQFKTATLTTTNTWELTDLIWGVNDTVHLLGTTVEGDTFVLLSDSALLRIPVSADAVGVEKLYKVVSAGQAIDDVDPISFTTLGLCYQRLCPATVISATVTDPPVSPAHGDSYLLPNDTGLTGLWYAHGGEIATWSDETGAWVFCTPVPGAVIHISEGEDTAGLGGTDVISGGDGTYSSAPWTPAIPPLEEATPADADYIVFHDGVGYKKTQVGNIGGAADTGSPSGGETYLTLEDETATLPNSLQLLPGDNVDFDQDTSGNTLRINATAAMGAGLTLVASATVEGAAATTLPLSGLDLDADGLYLIVIRGRNATTSTATLSLFFNSDTTAANYYADIQSNGSATQANNAGFTALFNTTNSQLLSYGLISRPGTRIQAALTNSVASATSASTRAQVATVQWDTLSTNLTGLLLSSNVASSLAIGFNITVWRLF